MRTGLFKRKVGGQEMHARRMRSEQCRYPFSEDETKQDVRVQDDRAHGHHGRDLL
jgi:hypothetical protein